ncbi:hypothetical protein ScPMuIL_015955 [Solemya velum]
MEMGLLLKTSLTGRSPLPKKRKKTRKRKNSKSQRKRNTSTSTSTVMFPRKMRVQLIKRNTAVDTVVQTVTIPLIVRVLFI